MKTSIQMSGCDTNDFQVDLGLYKVLTISPFLFTIVMDELPKEIQDEVLWCILFANNIVLVEETKGELTVSWSDGGIS